MSRASAGARADGKKRRFVAQYLVDLNATQAAIRAGYSNKTARVQASVLLTNPNIEAAVAAGQARQLAQADLTAVATKEAVRRQVCRDVRRLFDAHGNLRPIHRLRAEDAAMIAGFEVVIKNAEGGDGHTDRVLKVRLTDHAAFVQTSRAEGMRRNDFSLRGVPECRIRLITVGQNGNPG